MHVHVCLGHWVLILSSPCINNTDVQIVRMCNMSCGKKMAGYQYHFPCGIIPQSNIFSNNLSVSVTVYGLNAWGVLIQNYRKYCVWVEIQRLCHLPVPCSTMWFYSCIIKKSHNQTNIDLHSVSQNSNKIECDISTSLLDCDKVL